MFAAVLLALAGIAAAAERPDFIELPARLSARASQTLQIAVTTAGSRLVSVGERGVVLWSDDIGRTWTQAKVPVSVTLTGVQFIDERHGWVVGHDGVVLRSDDAGQTWTRVFEGSQANALVTQAAEQGLSAARAQLAAAAGAAKQAAQQALERAEFALDDARSAQKAGPSRPLLGLWFGSPLDGYVVGSYGQIFHTRDGGKQWQFIGARMDNPDGLHLNAIQGNAEGTLIVAAESGKVFRSDDRGQHWRTLNTGYNGPLYGVLDLGEPQAASLLAFGFGGRIFRSGNGGARWEAIDAGDRRATLVAGRRLPSGPLLLLAQDGTLWRSADAGRSVQPVGKAAAALRVSGLTALADGAGAALAGLGGVVIMPLAAKP